MRARGRRWFGGLVVWWFGCLLYAIRLGRKPSLYGNISGSDTENGRQLSPISVSRPDKRAKNLCQEIDWAALQGRLFCGPLILQRDTDLVTEQYGYIYYLRNGLASGNPVNPVEICRYLTVFDGFYRIPTWPMIPRKTRAKSDSPRRRSSGNI